MKSGVSNIIGKRILAVVVASEGKGPRQQLFLVFSDGTQLEVYGDSFNCASGLDRGGVDEAIRYAKAVGCKVLKVVKARPPGLQMSLFPAHL